MSSSNTLGLYIHIPFCQHRCSYCDFNTYTSLGNLKTAYSNALVTEIAQVGGEGATGGKNEARLPVHTLFLGGGTPSLMSPALLKDILQAVRTHFTLSPHAEITMEVNPGTVDADYLTAVRALGINRLSFGVQSVVAEELALLERQHDFQTVVEVITMSRQAGFNNFNLDLIYGLPDQSLDSWAKSVRACLDLAPTHLSLYCLTIEPGTPMHRWLNNGRITPPDPDLAADQYQLAGELMAQQGFVHYEISNWAKPGLACQHNLVYWRNGEYLGLGAGAHGHADGYRYAVVKQPRVYIRRLRESNGHRTYPWSTAVDHKHKLSRTEAMSDTIITQLRLLEEGLDLTAFAAQFEQTIHDAYGPLVGDLQAWGLVAEDNGRLRLTEQGRFLSNQVFYRFM